MTETYFHIYLKDKSSGGLWWGSRTSTGSRKRLLEVHGSFCRTTNSQNNQALLYSVWVSSSILMSKTWHKFEIIIQFRPALWTGEGNSAWMFIHPGHVNPSGSSKESTGLLKATGTHFSCRLKVFFRTSRGLSETNHASKMVWSWLSTHGLEIFGYRLTEGGDREWNSCWKSQCKHNQCTMTCIMMPNASVINPTPDCSLISDPIWPH